MTTRQEVVACARSWLRVRYEHQHRDRTAGVDCAGLVIVVARELGLVAPDFDVNGYARIPNGDELLAICDRFMSRIDAGSVAPGDVLVYRFRDEPQHLGIVGDYPHGGRTLIHALGTTDGRGRVIEWPIERRRKGWMPVQGYALPGVA